MTIFKNEQEILEALDKHDALILQYAREEISLEDFLKHYNSFPFNYALDGHESDAEEKILLSQYSNRIQIHWDLNDILSRMCSDEDSKTAQYIYAGRIDSKVVHQLTKDLVANYL